MRWVQRLIWHAFVQMLYAADNDGVADIFDWDHEHDAQAPVHSHP